MNISLQETRTYLKFGRLIPILFKSAIVCVAIIGSGIIFSSCQKDPAEDPTPPPPHGMHVKLPVIFHVIYKDRGDQKQYVNADRLKTILGNVNKRYSSTVGSVDINLEFVLATTAPTGKTLAAPGVEYINWSQAYPQESYPIDCNKIMYTNEFKYTPMLWEPNQYINVFLYNFTSGEDYITLGKSHFPYIHKDKNAPQGFTQTENTYLALENFQFAYGVSINSLFINDESTEEFYATTDINVTLAHELGHYLGLYHVFAQDHNGETLDNSIDTDYCPDTPSYNRVAYMKDYLYAMSHPEEGKYNFAYLVKRKNESGTFEAHNIMDYEVCYNDQFSADQRTRMRYVLENALAMPSAKKPSNRSRATKGGLDLPIVVME